MAKLLDTSHKCALTSPKTFSYGVCNVCYKDEPVEFACRSCNFDICKPCSSFPQKVYHDFHPDHSLEFCLFQYDRKPRHVICPGCGNMCSGSFYECKECEIYLDLHCAFLKNIVTGWDLKELLHYSHAHMLKRCRPGPDARGACLLCELPLSPSAICYGCVHCYSFVHEHCIDFPTEIQHPVHPTHPLKRLDYIQSGTKCNACTLSIDGVPFGCVECNFNLHMRCADSLLRGLMHKSHEHMLFYVATGSNLAFGSDSPCQICMRTDVVSLASYFHCVECKLKFHFECLDIPKSLLKKSYHIHPLVCKIYLPEEDSLEYCGVCETTIHSGHYTYSCQECDFLGHIGCILREVEPSPLYLKHIYSCGGNITRSADEEDNEDNKSENELLVNDTGHVHVMRSVHMNELDERKNCSICGGTITGSPFKCKTCCFQTHDVCAELGKPSRHRLHSNHPLILMPKPPARDSLNCEICKTDIHGFNLLCRICNYVIDISCALKGKNLIGLSHRGQKVVGTWTEKCVRDNNRLVQVFVSSSYSRACTICDERLCGTVVSCIICAEVYHSWCHEDEELNNHPLHPDHTLKFTYVSGSKCIVCKMDIKRYGYNCWSCNVNFHNKCIKAVSVSEKLCSGSHNLYNFWIDNLRTTRACNVCARPCGASFYGCIDCYFSAHPECIGFPRNVKNQRHQHSVVREFSTDVDDEICSLCQSECTFGSYSCKLCKVFLHKECIMSTDDRETAAIEEEQLADICLMYIERDLLNLFEEEESSSDFFDDIFGNFKW